ncbi:MAG: AMP-binding protein, partial [Myxococcales bacterium]|nr:AMP-binding protein [Myxococcales bacterium]
MEREDLQRTVPMIAEELVRELRPDHPRLGRLGSDSRLDRDLGLDSLGRVELVGRIERALSVSLPEDTFAQAETLSDLIQAVRAATPHGHGRASEFEPLPLGTIDSTLESTPDNARSLLDVLRWHADRHPDRPHVYLLEAGEGQTVLSYADLLREASQRAGALLALGVEPREQVALMLPTGRDYLTCFFAALLAGCVPVPIYPPARPSQLEDHLTRHARILDNARCTVLITVSEAEGVARLLRSAVPTLRAVKTPKDLSAVSPRVPVPTLRPEDTAFLQYTSGSTGQPKGVVLSHGNLLANIRAMGNAAEVTPQDVMVSWLPLYHDMGLIGGWLTGLYYAMPVALMSPLSFLARPERWLWAIHRYRGTISASPNFAYELAVRKVRDEDIDGLDLSSWRFALNGAEAVSPRTLESFCSRFAPYGFRASSMSPVFGLAECSVGLAFPPMNRGPVVERVGRERFARSGQALPAAQGEEALEVVACGRPLPEHEIRIVDAMGREVPERQEGRLQFRGPSCTSGYFRNPEQTARLF